jgi:hypothetical protein
MLKKGAAFLFFFTSIYSNAMKMNFAGHFPEKNKNEIEFVVSENREQISADGKLFDGNSVFKTSSGYVTLFAAGETAATILRLYNFFGEEYYYQEFPQIINLNFSENKNYLSFSNGKKLYSLDVYTTELRSFPVSNAFCADDKGNFIYYAENSNSIIRNNAMLVSVPKVYKIFFLNNNLYFITYYTVQIIVDNQPVTIFTAPAGRIFDYATDEAGTLFISTKTSDECSFTFTAYSISDLIQFTKTSESVYLRAHCLHQQRTHESDLNVSTSFEAIRNPLKYYSDTIYQEVGNSYNELQTYGSPAYLHPGVDLFGVNLEDVYSVKDGFVKAIITISGTYHWRIAIANQNTTAETQGYLYAHIDENTFLYAVDDTVSEGDVIGQLVDFPVAGFVHCHFARIYDQGPTWFGAWWTVDNPLKDITTFFDSIPPEFEMINDVFAFRDLNGNYLSADSLYGNVQIIAKVFDRINSSWKCDVDSLRYSISLLNAPSAMLLDTLAFDYGYPNDNYGNQTYTPVVLNAIYSFDAVCMSAADYNVREYYHIITNSDGNDTIDGTDALNFFNTLNFPDDDYILRVTAFDASGNSASDSMIFKTRNLNSSVNNLTDGSISLFPNPTASKIIKVAGLNDNERYYHSVCTIPGKLLSSKKILSDEINLSDFSPGVYMVRIESEKNIFYRKVQLY